MNEEALACAVARAHFGTVVADVVRVLLAHPGCPLAEIAVRCRGALVGAQTEVSSVAAPDTQSSERAAAATLRDALAVLLQHGIVVADEQSPHDLKPQTIKAGAPKGTVVPRDRSGSYCVYRVSTLQLLYRCRFPLFLGLVRKTYGELGEAIVRALFERGRLTSKQIFDAALNEVLMDLSLDIEDAEACLTDMAKAGLLIWAGNRLYGPSSAEDEEDEDHDDGRRSGRKRSRTTGAYNGFSDLNGGTADYSHSKTVLPKVFVGRGDRRRAVGAPLQENDLDVWRICFWHLNRIFRNECCLLVVRSRVDDEIALRILRAGLHLALDEEDCEMATDDVETVEVTTDAVQRHLADEDVAVSSPEFWGAIRVLMSQTPCYAKGIPELSPTKLRFVPGLLIAEARRQTLEDLILSRYDAPGRRVFRALAIDGAMEEKMLAEKCMMPLKFVREHLFRMYNDRLVTMQEVPRSHEQQRANNWYYLWRISPLSAFKNMLDIMYKAQLNLFLKLEAIDKDKPALDEKAQRAHANSQSLLTASILRMDQSIMVMRDFGQLTSNFFPARYRIVDGPRGKVKKRR